MIMKIMKKTNYNDHLIEILKESGPDTTRLSLEINPALLNLNPSAQVSIIMIIMVTTIMTMITLIIMIMIICPGIHYHDNHGYHNSDGYHNNDGYDYYDNDGHDYHDNDHYDYHDKDLYDYHDNNCCNYHDCYDYDSQVPRFIFMLVGELDL